MPATIVTRLRECAAHSGSKIAYRFLDSGEVDGPIRTLTFEELDAQARAVAAMLQERVRPGDRALLVFAPGMDFIPAFYGCLYAEVMAVPIVPPDPTRLEQTLPRVQAIVEDAQPTVALSTEWIVSMVGLLAERAPRLLSIPWLTTDSVEQTSAEVWRPTDGQPDSPAFLQYTSGSTSTPKGVMVTHSNLIANGRAIASGFGLSVEKLQDHPGDFAVGWLPLFHDMGLIGHVLQALHMRATSTLMSPQDFIQRPIRWLNAVSHFKAFTSGGPNFGYALTSRKATEEDRDRLDLSSWRVAYCGAEPVRPEALRAFADTFAACGFQASALAPTYGLAESTLLVSGRQNGASPVYTDFRRKALEQGRAEPATREEDAQTLVGCGRAGPETVIRIVDPKARVPLASGRIGEVWTASPSVAKGYFRRPEVTEEVFGATLADPTDTTRFLRTGDLGFLDEHGELYITGRRKDLIIVRGRNLYPQDIEARAEAAHPAIRSGCSAAFPMDRDGEDRLGLVVEIDTKKLGGASAGSVLKTLRTVLLESFDVELEDLACIAPRTIPKTSSGKIQRRRTKAALLAQELEILARWRAPVAAEADAPPPVALTRPKRLTREALEELIAELLRADPRLELATRPGRQVPFVELGLNSLSAVELSGRLSETLGRPLPSTLLFEFPTISALAAELADERELQAELSRDQPTPAEPAEPIAIVGIGCRFPGGVVDPDTFWALLHHRTDAIMEVPPDRFDIEAFYDPDPDAAGKVMTRHGGFVPDVDLFDAEFFGISPKEAEHLDPQQRLVLECAWEALERGGLAPARLAGSKTGVFVGLSYQEYASRLGGPETVDGFTLTGNTGSVASGRLSYWLGLLGPSVTVDTACSSSLVALHLACRSLADEECSLAVAGGVTLMLSPAPFLAFSRVRGLAPDGRSKAFDASADGVAWGEGCGMLVLKRLADAERDKDPIQAVIRGSAINQDGRSNGLTAPSGPAQRAVLREALIRAGRAAPDVQYVECHGTGTALGDPIEVRALGAVLGEGRPTERPLLIGSVKTNIGHAQAAAGVAGIIKTVLAMKHERIPASLHFERPSPHIPWSDLALQVAAEETPWPAGDTPRIAGVSSFGISGTNVHVILEEAPPRPTPPRNDIRGPQLAVLSGRTPAAVASQAERLRARLEQDPPGLPALANALATTRTHFRHRLAVPVTSVEALREALGSVASRRPAPACIEGDSRGPGRLAFLFTGQGSQYAGMGRGLYDRFDVFRDALDEVAVHLDAHLDRPILSVMFAAPDSDEAELLNQTALTQPALFALEVALFRLWRSWGVRPALLLGHSVGELAAAHVAGVFSIEDGAKLVCARGRLMQSVRTGGMVSIQATETEILPHLEPYEDRVDIAGLNGPTQTVISGDEDVVLAIAHRFEEQGRKTARLPVSHAFHSPHNVDMLYQLWQVAETCTFHPPEIPVVSTTVTRELAAEEPLTAPDYWIHHARKTVRYMDGIRSMNEQGATTFVECGPHGVLSALGPACLTDTSGVAFTPSLHRGEDDTTTILKALGTVHVRGHDVDWSAHFRGTDEAPVELPTYPFQRKRYWLSAPENGSTEAGSKAEQAFWRAVEGQDAALMADVLDLPDEARGQVATLLPHLASWRRRGLADEAVGHCLYDEVWQQKPATPPGLGAIAGRWLVVARSHQAKLAGEIIRRLEGAGARVGRLVDSAPATLRAELEGAAELRGIVTLTPLDEAPDPQHPAAPRGLTDVLNLIQAQEAAGSAAPVWLFTRGAVAVDGSDPLPHPLQASAWGLGRVAGLEHADRWGGLVDLPDRIDDRAGQQLIATLAGADDEDQVALRRAGRFVRRLVRSRPEVRPMLEVRGTVLITGGTGAIGQHIARWLVRAHGARHLVLTSRRGPRATGATGLVQELRELGAEVEVVACDVSSEAEVSRLLDTLPADTPLGIVHAAGVLDNLRLKELSPERLASVLAPKIRGADNLHRLTALRELEFFVMLSSVAGAVGSTLQANYAAANSFLDALATHRRRRGQTGTALAFGPWAGGGMLDGAATEQLRRRGLSPLEPAAALRGLELGVGADRARLLIADIDWSRFAATFAAMRPRPLLLGIEDAKSALFGSPEPAGNDRGAEIRSALQGLPAKGRQALLEDLVATETAAVLGAGDPRELDRRTGFLDLGLDSLLAVELRTRIAARTGLRIPATLVFDHPTLEDAAAWLGRSLTTDLTRAGTPEDDPREARREPVAIVGVGFRFPGGANDLDTFWELLSKGEDAVRLIPKSRFDIDASFDPDPDARGTSYVRHAAMLGDVESFDAAFFGIRPAEAQSLDPQHRLLLEAAWTALEDAGIPPERLRGTDAGVFVGIGPNEYSHDPGLRQGEADVYDLAGSQTSFAAGRVAYHLGLCGPALAVDTACSSSLVALSLAQQALQKGECKVALAGGVQVLADPNAFILLCRTRALAPDGRSKTFSARANGYGRGEGVGVLALMRLSDAQAAGHRIHGLIVGTAVNHDGASSSLVAPNGSSQQRVLAAALADAGLSPADVGVVECHGTGTALGDPIEVQALAAVYGDGRDPDEPLALGAVKSTIGHTESAAGVAGVLKVLSALRHDALPPTLHTSPPNPHIEWDALAVRVVDRLTPWPRQPQTKPRRAGVSAFGLSGTNAHVIIEEAPVPERGSERPALPLPLLVSGRDPTVLREQAGRWSSWLSAHQEVEWPAAVHTAAAGRTHFSHRAAVFATNRIEGARALAALARGETDPAVSVGAPPETPGRVAFLFTGQGSQRAGMGAQLYRAQPRFAALLDEVCGALDRHLSTALLPRMFEGSSLDPTEVAQPALFALEVALCRLWRSWGIEPESLLGHSVGELAAAHVAGVLSLADAAKLVAARGRLMQACPTGGLMVSIAASEEEVLPLLDDRVAIAAINEPKKLVVSGDEGAVSKIQAHFEGLGRSTSRLTVSHAFHSPHMDGMIEPFLRVAETCTFHTPQIPIISSVTGAPATAESLMSPAYWAEHARATVRFADGMQVLSRSGCDTFLECGPAGVLSAAGALCLEDGGLFVPSLRRHQDEAQALASALGALHVGGQDIDWPEVFESPVGARIDLPTYPFQRRRYWRSASPVRPAVSKTTGHPLLGFQRPIAGANLQVFDSEVSRDAPRWVADHVVQGDTLFPGTGFWELMHAAGRSEMPDAFRLCDVTMARPLPVPESGSVPIQVTVQAEPSGADRKVAVYSLPSTLHAEGRLVASIPPAPGRPPALPPAGAPAVDVSRLYSSLADRGLRYGPGFSLLEAAWRQGSQIWARLSAPDSEDASGYGLHPAVLDAALHGVALARDPGEGVFVPFALGELCLWPSAGPITWVHVHSVGESKGGLEASLTLFDSSGAPAARLTGVSFRRAQPTPVDRMRFSLAWRPTADRPSAAPRARWGLWCWGGPAAWVDALGAELGTERLETPLDRPDLDGLICAWAKTDPDTAEATAAKGLELLKDLVSADPARRPRRVCWVTRGAIAAKSEDRVPGLASRALWGLARTAREEHPELALTLLDLEVGDDGAGEDGVRAALSLTDEPEVALRDGQILLPRMIRAKRRTLPMPEAGAWRLQVEEQGRLDRLAIVETEFEALPQGHVRVKVEAAGLNFKDVLNALGMVPFPWIGLELAGVITEIADGVSDLEVGDRVMGLGRATFAASAVADVRHLTRIPPNLTFEEAATVPLTFLTARYALFELGDLKPSERILIHAAAGGVGMAAVQLAKRRGAEVFGTASPGKWGALQKMGLASDHIASSRSLGFGETFGKVDVVLGALAEGFVDESLSLLSEGGRFLEMGKTDVRDPSWIEQHHPKVRYQAFDLSEAEPERIQRMLSDLAEELAAGTLSPLPRRVFDIRRAPDAFRFMAEARHVGKVVLVPRKPLIQPESTVLITGGLGAIGAHIARWLVSEHGVRRLILTSRRGLEAPGASELVSELEGLGADVDVRACDVSDEAAVGRLLESVEPGHPIRGVVHAAGVLDDGLLATLTPERLGNVFAPKVRGATILDRASAEMDLDFFVLLSSVSAVVGSGGQATYSAANAFLNGLAQRRRAAGQPATSIAFGPWADGGMVDRLADQEQARLQRQGLGAIRAEVGVELVEAAIEAGEPLVIAAAFDPTRMTRSAPIFEQLAGRPTRSRGNGLLERLRAASPADRRAHLLELVRGELRAVLGLSSEDAVNEDRTWQDLGVDSLAAVELRNRLNGLTGAKLPATAIFDYPNPGALTGFLAEQIGEPTEATPVDGDASVLSTIAEAIKTGSTRELERLGLLDGLLQLAGLAASNSEAANEIESGIGDDELLALAKEELEEFTRDD